MSETFVEKVSKVLLELLVQNANNPSPDPYSYQFSDWEREIKIQTDYIAEDLIELFDKRYRLKD